jgi:hypothetical protein
MYLLFSIQRVAKRCELTKWMQSYELNVHFKTRLKEALVGTAYENKAAEIINFADNNASESPKSLYAGTLHNFGRSDGLVIYRILKETIS